MSRFEGYGRSFSAIIDDLEDKQRRERYYRDMMDRVTLSHGISSAASYISIDDIPSVNKHEPTINLYRAMEENQRLKQELSDALAENKYLKEIIEEGDVNVKA